MPPTLSESADGSVMVVSLAIRKNVSIAGANVVDSEFSRYASNDNAVVGTICVGVLCIAAMLRRL
jgi:hypothetical protein